MLIVFKIGSAVPLNRLNLLHQLYFPCFSFYRTKDQDRCKKLNEEDVLNNEYE